MVLCPSFLASCRHLIHQRDNVKPLVTGVTGAHYKRFSTEDEAIRAYLDAKKGGLLVIIRDPDDDEIYGPRSDAAP